MIGRGAREPVDDAARRQPPWRDVVPGTSGSGASCGSRGLSRLTKRGPESRRLLAGAVWLRGDTKLQLDGTHATNLFRMSDVSRHRGSQRLSDRDWMFGSRPRRRLLEATLLTPPPRAGWTRRQLAELAGVVANGGVDEHLGGLERLGLLKPQQGAPPVWHPVRPRPELGSAVRRVLVALSDQNDEPAASASRADAGSSVLAVEAAVRVTKRCVHAAGDELDAATAAEVISLLDQIEGHVQAARREARR